MTVYEREFKPMTAPEYEAVIEQKKGRIAELMEHCRTAEELKELKLLRREVAELEDDLILAKHLDEQRQKDKAELKARILKEQQEYMRDFKRLVFLASETLPVLESLKPTMTEVSDLCWRCMNAVNTLRMVTGEYSGLYQEHFEIKFHPSLDIHAVRDYEEALADIIKRLSPLVPEPEEKVKP